MAKGIVTFHLHFGPPFTPYERNLLRGGSALARRRLFRMESLSLRDGIGSAPNRIDVPQSCSDVTGAAAMRNSARSLNSPVFDRDLLIGVHFAEARFAGKLAIRLSTRLADFSSNGIYQARG